jgi:hypothetical protein
MVRHHVLGTVLLCASGFAFADPPALPVNPAPPPAGAPPASIAGWNELVDGLRNLPNRMLAKLPEPLRNDPQVQQEVGRLILESLASSTIDAIGGDGDHPTFLPQINQTLNVGQPNADTVYRIARITPGGTYRLRGQRGSLRIASIGQLGPTPGEPGSTSPQPGPTRVYNDINALHADTTGNFDVLLSANRPEGYKGDWWQLSPTANKLLVRMVSSDWSHERPLTLSIERVDTTVEKPRPPAADLEQRLRRLPDATAFMALLFVDHVETLRQQGYINNLKVFDTSQIGGLSGQFYYEGAYDLHDDEALIIESKVPSNCLYRSLILTNEIYETTDWYNNYSSLNDSQARADKDGVLRIVVSAKDPGVPNWLDTAGYPRGVVQGRWTGCATQPIPSVKKVTVAEVRDVLPRDTPLVTPVQRQAQIRARRLVLEQRALW